MPKVGGGGTRGGIGAGAGINRNFNMGLGGGAAAALAGLASWIQANSPNIDSGIFSNPIPDVRRPSIFSTPIVNRLGPNITSTPAMSRRSELATRFPVATRSAADGILITPKSDSEKSNIVMISPKDIKGMANDPNYKTGTRKKSTQQQNHARKRYGASVPKTEIVNWANEAYIYNPTYSWNSKDARRIDMGHDLTNPFLQGKGSKNPTHYVDTALNDIAGKLIEKDKVPIELLKDGKDYTPIIDYIVNNPNDSLVKTFHKRRPGLKNKSLIEIAEKIGANHLINLA